MAAATGLVTTYLPVQRWRRPARWALHGGMAVAAGGAMALALRRPGTLRRSDDEPREALAPLPTAVVATGIAALVLGVSRGGQAADEWAERRLSARGVRRPRAWMGAAAAVASLAMSASDKRGAAQEALDAQSSSG
ncbi:alpha/beta-hydrolase N-terminal domain-containing protein [Nocardioides baculatus]|uniref:Alpha/beta-hydrolase N-terminal domain-containing protein n=1 Tax=Nocardioides baculatus TaxID=2801337 RepID=A0ABS1L8H5_9ACTN|nr:alpha/beta-hydrolase N-terminal domain-containing protein [Nocardioides baculatus]MBL0747993.1 hypothetical protein [Nocardioides baculatus]